MGCLVKLPIQGNIVDLREEFIQHCENIMNKDNTLQKNIMELMQTINWTAKDLKYLSEWSADIFYSFDKKEVIARFTTMWDDGFIRNIIN